LAAAAAAPEGRHDRDDDGFRADLALMQHLVLVDAREQAPTRMAALRGLLTDSFQALRSCMLLFGHRQSAGTEWVTATVAVGGPAREPLKEMMVIIGLPKGMVLEVCLEALGCAGDSGRQKRQKRLCSPRFLLRLGSNCI
jgi:hypothetical protein